MGDVDKDFFERKIRDLDLTQREVARQLNMHFASFHRVISGSRKVQLDELVGIAQLIRTPLPEVIEAFGVPMPPREHRAEVTHTIVDGNVVPASDHRKVPALEPGLDAIFDETTGWVYFVPVLGKRVEPEAVDRLSLMQVPGGIELGTLKRDRLTGRYDIVRVNGEVVRGATVHAAVPVAYIKP